MLDPFGRSQLPPEHRARDPERARRVRLLAECCQELLDGRLPSHEARLFVAGGALSWLQEGGDLLREFWKVSGPAGSHHTPSYVWRQINRERASSAGETNDDDDDTIAASDSERTS